MNDETKVSDLTVSELKEIIRALILESKYRVMGIDPAVTKIKLPTHPDSKTTIYCSKEDKTVY